MGKYIRIRTNRVKRVGGVRGARGVVEGRGRSGPGERWPLQERAAGGKSELHRAGCWLTASRGDPQDSATENRPPPPATAGVRVKRCGKSAPRPGRPGRHGKPHLEQEPIGERLREEARTARPTLPGRSLTRHWATRALDECSPPPKGGTELGLQDHSGLFCRSYRALRDGSLSRVPVLSPSCSVLPVRPL